jgi:hypothetical protein
MFERSFRNHDHLCDLYDMNTFPFLANAASAMRFQFSKGESRDRVIFRADLDDQEFVPKHDSKRASIKEPAIAYGTGQQFARGRADRFRTTRWSVVLLSAQIGAKGRLGP